MPNGSLGCVFVGVLGSFSVVGCQKLESQPQPGPTARVVRRSPDPALNPAASAAIMSPATVVTPPPARLHEPVDDSLDRSSSDDRADRASWYRRRAINVRWFVALTRDQRGNVKQVCALRSADPCAGLLRPFTAAHPDPTIPLLASLSTQQRAGVGPYCGQLNEGHAGCNTPLVVAFDAQPIEFTTSSQSFAFHANQPSRTDFPTVTTPWIALDRDGDGAITSGAELFGDATPLPSGDTALDGYAALAVLDADGDGVIDRRDPAFASLLLWRDLDGNGTSSRDELRPLAATITAIPLAHIRTARCTERGDCEGERGALVWRDERGSTHTGAVVDVYLAIRRN